MWKRLWSRCFWSTECVFHFVYQMLTGDGQIMASVDGVQNTYAHAKPA